MAQIMTVSLVRSLTLELLYATSIAKKKKKKKDEVMKKHNILTEIHHIPLGQNIK